MADATEKTPRNADAVSEAEPGPEAPSADGKLCAADRMQRRHCAFYHEKTGRCTQTHSGTWQERAARDAAAPSADS